MTPTLTQVLSQGGAASQFNLTFLAAGLAVFFVAAISIVKGREFLSREAPCLAEIEAKEKLEKLSFLVDGLKAEKAKLAEQNTGLQNQLGGLNDALKNEKQTSEIMEKSNFVLLKECNKLKSEKEGLVLDAHKPLIKISKRALARKPKRVLKKKKK